MDTPVHRAGLFSAPVSALSCRVPPTQDEDIHHGRSDQLPDRLQPAARQALGHAALARRQQEVTLPVAYLAQDPDVLRRFPGRVVGDGHCIALVRAAVPDLPPTSQWRPGPRVRDADPPVPKGAVIATFDPATRTYTNRADGTAHAAIFLAATEQGLLVLDQWVGQPAHQRTIRFRGTHLQDSPQSALGAANDGDRFHVVA